MLDQPGTSSVSREFWEACKSTGKSRCIESTSHVGQATSGVKVRETSCQAGGGEEVLAWKPWKVVDLLGF